MLQLAVMQRGEYEKRHEVKDGSALKIGVVVSSFNADITESMLDGALATLKEWGVKTENITVRRVPGSFEIPYGCLQLIQTEKLDAIVAIGCIIKGDTEHDRYIARAVTDGIMRLTLDHQIPISFGVITTNTLAQAQVRSTGETNKGIEATRGVLELVLS